MRNAIAVIGANYGDEGKGLATDFFSRQYDADLVTRCNGGAQAGHTVVHGDKRHVFGHVGAGALAGKPTYLSSGFIVNPMVLRKELQQLTFRQRIYGSPDCRVTTVFDMAINSLIELKRGADRHGSCGMGINETVTRHAAGFFLDLKMIHGSGIVIKEALQRIKEYWVPERLTALGLSKEDFEGNEKALQYFDLLETNVDKLVDDLLFNSELIKIADPKFFLDDEKPIVVEGAQGLMLDEFLGEFPHVTRSVTGLASSIKAAAECGKTSIRPVYITRAYATRHGAGPLSYEGATITDKEIELDQTNVHNPWQGTIRYAPLDLNAMSRFIRDDMKRGEAVGQLFGVQVLEPMLFITCVDQLGEFVYVGSRTKELVKMRSIKLIPFIEKVMGMEVCATAHGPSASSIQLHQAVL